MLTNTEPTSRQILVQLVNSLEEEPDIQSFENPVEGLDWMAKNPVDLLLVDYKMPEMNGIEVIKKFRSNPACGLPPTRFGYRNSE